jgi:spermidine synthase
VPPARPGEARRVDVHPASTSAIDVPRATPSFAPVTLSEADGVRYLHLGSIWVQGAMRIRKPQWVELVYVQRMLASLLWLPSSELGQGHAVQLGLGAGAITRFTHQRLRMRTTAVELNPAVVDVCRHWFHVPADDDKLRVVTMDAGRWLAREAAPQSVQLLHVDLYDHEAAAPVLDDEAFYAGCHTALAVGGVMAVNLFGRDASLVRSCERIARVFGADQLWTLQPTREGNTVVVAARGVVVPGREELQARAETIERRFGDCGLAARKWLRCVRPGVPAPC